MSRINSLTDTTGFMSPHSAGTGGDEGFGLGGEHADIKALTINSPAQQTPGVPTEPFDMAISNRKASGARPHLTARISRCLPAPQGHSRSGTQAYTTHDHQQQAAVAQLARSSY
jgi:hypothetical protein